MVASGDLSECETFLEHRSLLFIVYPLHRPPQTGWAKVPMESVITGSKIDSLLRNQTVWLSKFSDRTPLPPFPLRSTSYPKHNSLLLRLTNYSGFLWFWCAGRDPALKSYQLIGLNWLAVLHKQDVNAVLADEMGLGKTVQSIAFLAHLFELGEGPFLVVVPSSTLENWKREFEMWCPCLQVVECAGPAGERRALYSQIKHGEIDFDVCLTSYAVCTANPDDRKFIYRQKFACAVFDEGHMLKNMKSKRYQTLMKIKAARRVLLTGTPLQNNLLELISLISFIMPKVFTGEGTTEAVRRMFNRNRDGEGGSSIIAHVKRIIAPFLLRRLKAKVGHPPTRWVQVH